MAKFLINVVNRQWTDEERKEATQQFMKYMEDQLKLTDVEINWGSLFDNIGQAAYQSAFPDNMRMMEHIRERFLGVLLTRGWDEDNDIRRFFEHYFRSLKGKVWTRFPVNFRDMPWLYSNPNLVTWFQSGTYLTHVGHIYSLLPFYLEFKPQTTGETAEWMAMHAGDWKFLAALLKYGRWNDRVDSEAHMLREDFNELWWFYIGQHQQSTVRERIYRLIKAGNKLREIRGNLLGAGRRGFRRILLIVRTLRAVMGLQSHNKHMAEKHVKCLELYFSTLNDPLVSADEVEEFLLHMTKGENRPQVVDCVLNKWIELFGQTPYEPRDLQHLCRGALRKALLKSKSDGVLLPKRVELLNIPQKLKSYLLCVPKWKSV